MAGKKKDPLRLYLVDGSAYIFRAYHALPPLSRKSDGLPVGAVSGFCNMLYKLLADMRDEHDPTHLAVIFDFSAKTFRNEIYADYKANRPEPPEDLKPQFPLVREATRAFNLPCIEIDGYEADDIIATYAKRAEAEGGEAVIISSDKDLMQLVSDRVTMFDTMKNKAIGRDEVIEKFGLGPEYVVDIQALAGDSTDNVPGVPGIGVKTAAQLLKEYGDLENLLARAEEVKQKKRRENLIEFADQARISKKLVVLDAEVPLSDDIEDFAIREIDAEKLIAFLDEMEFTTLTRRVESDLGVSGGTPTPTAPSEAEYGIVFDEKDLKSWIEKARELGTVAFDTETDGLDPMRARLVGFSMATAPGRACYVPLGHGGEGLDLEDDDGLGRQMDFDAALELIKPLLEDSAILKVGQNLKFDALVLARYGVRVTPYDDTMLISYALDCGRGGHGMDELAERHLGRQTIKFSDIAGSGKKQKTFNQIAIKDAAPYAAEDADVTFRLYGHLKPRLAAEGKASVYETLDRPLAPIITEMERAGVKIDPSTLSKLSGEFAQRMAALEAEAYEAAGGEFNLGSPKQISEILFGDLGLPGGRKTSKGAWSTKADILEELAAEGHELPRIILDWRGLSKLKSTYTDALPKQIDPETGRVHTSYALAATTTGRLSSTEPNLQNIPIRTEDGRKIRRAFVAEPGHVLISADYSQIELRLFAHIADIDAMKQAFADGVDIHAMTASEMFGVPIDGMDPMVRRRAKAINFGIIYGISAYGLSNQLRIPRGEAKAYIDSYFEKFPGIRRYMDATKSAAKADGYVETIFGRRTHVAGIRDKNPAMRAYAERQAINAPIQGSAADIIRRAMIRMPAELARKKLEARMLLQVHDELIFEAPKGEAADTCAVVASVMQGAPDPVLTLSVPLDVEAKAGRNWAEAH